MTAVSARSMQEEEAKEDAKVPSKVQEEARGLFPARAVDRDGEHLPKSPLSPLSLSSDTAAGDSVVSCVSPLPIHGLARGKGGSSTPAWKLQAPTPERPSLSQLWWGAASRKEVVEARSSRSRSMSPPTPGSVVSSGKHDSWDTIVDETLTLQEVVWPDGTQVKEVPRSRHAQLSPGDAVSVDASMFRLLVEATEAASGVHVRACKVTEAAVHLHNTI